MKQLYNYRMLVSINGESYRDTSYWDHIKYLEPEKAKTRETEEIPFDEVYNFAEGIMNTERGKTFFLKKRYIKFSFSDDFYPVYVYEKTKSTIKVKEEYLPFSCSMKNLAELLKAEDFIEYLKDRGITTCPLNKG